MSIRRLAGIRLLLVAIAAGLGACGSGKLGTETQDAGISPGYVNFQLVVPSNRSFCEQIETCTPPDHFIFFTPSGEPLPTDPGWCPTMCSRCTPPPCPLIPCGTGTGTKANAFGTVWNGAVYYASTCGSNVGCVGERFVAPGRYVVRMCAVPGELTPSDAGTQNCTATGPEECVEVPFDMPGPLVTATLSP
jgi:hypothetical protein